MTRNPAWGRHPYRLAWLPLQCRGTKRHCPPTRREARARACLAASNRKTAWWRHCRSRRIPAPKIRPRTNVAKSDTCSTPHGWSLWVQDPPLQKAIPASPPNKYARPSKPLRGVRLGGQERAVPAFAASARSMHPASAASTINMLEPFYTKSLPASINARGLSA